MTKLWKLGLFLFVLSPGIARAQSGAAASDDWEFALTPFLWAPGMDGTGGLASQEADFEVSAEDLMESLDFGFMTNFEARKSRAGIRRVSASASLLTDEATITEVDGGFTDPIVGARFRRYLSDKFWVNLRGDVGGFCAGSDFSWFVSAAGGFRLSKLISLDFGYRIWGFDYKSDDDLKRLDLALAGFGAG